MQLEKELEKYAELIVTTGLNIQPGDKLTIRLNEHGLPLARIVSRKAYQKGALDVQLRFSDDRMTLDFYLYAPDGSFDFFPAYRVDYSEHEYRDGYHVLLIESPDPDILKHADPGKIARYQKTAGLANKRLQKYILENRVKWNISAVPGPAWAKAVFPELPPEEGMDRLWEAILHTSRVSSENPAGAWKKHTEELEAHKHYLNDAQFEKLLYRGPETDLEVFLVDNHHWDGGSSECNGVQFFPNIPTEEVFTMPHADRVNGTLKATMPLSVRGRIIDNFHFTFKDGKISDFDAETGKQILSDLLDMDEGARRLGEVALVAHHSPVSDTGLLFKSTLYDENASCHFAAGAALSENMAGAGDRSEDENRKLGMNNSLVHVDFMVGNEELEVTGVKKDGTKITLLKDGDWVI